MGKLYKSRKLIIITSWTLVILNLGLIFYFSSKSADQSKELSGNVTKIVAQSVQKVSPSNIMIPENKTDKTAKIS